MDEPQSTRSASADPAKVRVVMTSPPRRLMSKPVESAAPTPFGADLEPVVRSHCDGRLSRIGWFRTDWQRGGALTGYATYEADDGEKDVVVKLPVRPRERQWLMQLQGHDVAPRLFAHGEELGGYDMAWVIMERLPHGPIAGDWGAGAFDLLVDAVVRFTRAAAGATIHGEAVRRDYESIREEARENIHRHNVDHEQRWNRALKRAHHHLRDWLAVWHDRCTDHWCHGDLHPGNAMTRCLPPGGPAVLIDFAEVHRGHWIEDAVHLEHLYWSRRDKLDGRKICKLIARRRKQLGLHVDEHWPRLADIHRSLLAMSTPAVLRHMGDRHHVHAALEVLEAQVHR